MWFAGPAAAEIEKKLPREGQSFSPESYDIYNWQEVDE
jgi:hypothetical protein